MPSMWTTTHLVDSDVHCAMVQCTLYMWKGIGNFWFNCNKSQLIIRCMICFFAGVHTGTRYIGLSNLYIFAGFIVLHNWWVLCAFIISTYLCRIIPKLMKRYRTFSLKLFQVSNLKLRGMNDAYEKSAFVLGKSPCSIIIKCFDSLDFFLKDKATFLIIFRKQTGILNIWICLISRKRSN
jgi:hypothetical protein